MELFKNLLHSIYSLKRQGKIAKRYLQNRISNARPPPDFITILLKIKDNNSAELGELYQQYKVTNKRELYDKAISKWKRFLQTTSKEELFAHLFPLMNYWQGLYEAKELLQECESEWTLTDDEDVNNLDSEVILIEYDAMMKRTRKRRVDRKARPRVDRKARVDR